MRIIAGEWRGRHLAAPRGETTRPTADRTRETLFSMLASRLGGFDELLVADLFAGSGALGLEALSRGAARALFVENDREALNALRTNVETLAAGPRCTIRGESALRFVPPVEAPHLLLLDPPYGSGAGGVALDRLQRLGWIAPGAWIAMETAREEPVNVKGFDVETERMCGRARITMLRPAR